jgi:type I restriction enzyme S subunit
MKWAIKPFSEVVDILDSRRIPVNSTERAKRFGEVPYYGATGQVSVIDEFIFDEELVLLGEDGAPFLDSGKPKAYLIRGKSWVNNHAHVLRGKPGLLNGFLLYQLNNLDYRPYVSGTTRLKLPQGPMKQIPLLVPPPEEQQRIVAEIEKQFTRLEAGVSALRRVQANLKRYRASVLKAACEGKLVPTEAELAIKENRKADFETGEALLARILTERRKNWQGRGKYKEPAAPDTAKLPTLPEGWVWARLEQLGVIYGGLTKNPKRAKLLKQLPYLRVANVYANELRLDDIEYIGVADSELDKLLIRAGDLLIVEGNGSKDQIGRLAIWDGSIESCVHQNHLIKVRPIEPQMPKWILYWLQSPGGRQFVELVASSTSGLFTLSVNKVGNLFIPLPPLAEQTRIVAEVERRLSVVEELESVVTANLKRAARLRQSILQKAFTGELIK